MNKKTFLLMLLALASVSVFGCTGEEKIETVNISGEEIPVDTQELDLKGSSISDFSAVYQLYNLKQIDLRDTGISLSDAEYIRTQLPDCRVIFDVNICGNNYDSSAASLDISMCTTDDTDELIYKLSFFYNLREVLLKSGGIPPEGYRALKDAYPNASFKVNIEIGNYTFTNDESNIEILALDKVDIESLVNSLFYFDDLRQVYFGVSILNPDETAELKDAFPDTEIIWDAELAGRLITPDTTNIDISGTIIDDFEKLNDEIAMLPNAEYIDMCYCGLSNEEMETLQNNYPDKKFVWMIHVRNWEIRTDIKAFSTGNMEEFEGGYFLGGGRNLYDEDTTELKYCTDLIALDLGHQWHLTDFSFLEYMSELQYLIVAMTGIKDLSPISGLDNLMYLEIFNTGVSDLYPLTNLANLKHLNCSMTFARDTGALLEMTQLERLWIVSTYFSGSQIAELRETLADTVIVSQAKSPTHGGWRSKDAQVYIDMQELFNLPPLFSGDVVGQ